MVKLALVLYNLLFPVGFLLYFPFYLRRLRRRGGFWVGFYERFGFFSAAKRQQLRALRKPVWIHAVSVGEVNTALPFIAAWQARDPELQVVLSTTTSTGQQLARERAPAGVVPIYCPVDFMPCIWLSLSVTKPRLLVIFEVEIWPSTLAVCRARGVPAALVNGRLSDHTAAGFRRHRWLFRPVLGGMRLLAMQSADDAARLRQAIGDLESIQVCHTMKFDLSPEPQSADGPDLGTLFGPDPLVLCGASTWSGEETLLAQIFLREQRRLPALRLILVPRHVERCAAIAADLAALGLSVVRFTEWRNGVATDTTPTVLLVDVTGEMLRLLPVCDVVFVGKSLAGNAGGHNIIEPAVFAKPIIFGSAMGNFRTVVALFKERRAAIEVADGDELAAAVGRLLGDADLRREMGQAAAATVAEHRGGMAAAIALLRQIE